MPEELQRELRLRDRRGLPGADRGPPRGARRRRSRATGSERRRPARAARAQASARALSIQRRMSIEVKNGLPESVDHITLTLELTLDEAEALKAWLLKPAADGSAAIDDENAKSVMVKLGAKLDFIRVCAKVRDELEEAGFQTDNLSDEQVAELGRRIAETPIRRYSGKGPSPPRPHMMRPGYGRPMATVASRACRSGPAARGGRVVPRRPRRADRRLLDRARRRRGAGPRGRAARRAAGLRREHRGDARDGGHHRPGPLRRPAHPGGHRADPRPARGARLGAALAVPRLRRRSACCTTRPPRPSSSG